MTTNAAAELLADLRARGLSVVAEGETLRVGPGGLLTDADRAAIREHKPAILAELQREQPPHSGAGEDLIDAGAQLLAWGEAHGWPSLIFRPGLSIVEGEAAWRRFVRWGGGESVAAALAKTRATQGAS